MVKRGITPQMAKEIREKNGIEETKLQKIRVQRGLSQNQLAAKSGVTRRSIQCYEQQFRDIDGARLSTLCALCSVLDCNIEDILENEELIEKYKKVK